MDVVDLMERMKDAGSIKRVFGDPIEKDGVTVIPVALVAGGGGGGGDSNGSGGGFGVHARPLGVYVISGGKVRFQPAINPAAMMFLGFMLLRLVLRSRRRKAKKKKRH